MSILLVFLGGGLGSVFRFLTNELFTKKLALEQSGMLTSTLLVNVIGSLVAGIVFFAALNNMDPSNTKRLFLLAGFCGGFTTFSGFSLEVFKLFQSGDSAKAVAYILISSALSIAFLAVGFFGARAVHINLAQ